MPTYRSFSRPMSLSTTGAMIEAERAPALVAILAARLLSVFLFVPASIVGSEASSGLRVRLARSPENVEAEAFRTCCMAFEIVPAAVLNDAVRFFWAVLISVPSKVAIEAEKEIVLMASATKVAENVAALALSERNVVFTSVAELVAMLAARALAVSLISVAAEVAIDAERLFLGMREIAPSKVAADAVRD